MPAHADEFETLLHAIAGRYTNTAFRILESNTNFARANYYQNKLPLLEAAAAGDVPMLKRLVELGANLNALGSVLSGGGGTALHYAIRRNQPAACRWLIEAGADPNLMAFGYETPLHLAYKENREEMAGWLLDFGADPFRAKGYVNDHSTPFEYAIKSSSGRLVPRMLAYRPRPRGAILEPTLALKPGEPPPDPRAVQLLATNGTALLALAAKRGELEAVDALLQVGVRPAPATANEPSPLQAVALSVAAAERTKDFSPERWARIRGLIEGSGEPCDALAATGFGDMETALRLVSTDKNVAKMQHYQGETPLHWAVRLDRFSFTTFWLEMGANPATTNVAGQTPLHLAAEKGLAKHAERLLAAKSPTHLRDTNGWTPLEAAMQAKQTETIRLLLVNVPEQKPAGRGLAETIHEAAAKGNIVALTEFAKPDNLEARNELGFTPLHLAAQQGQLGAAAFLLDRGADVNARDAEGNTVLHLILSRGSHWVAGRPSDDWVTRKRNDPKTEKFWRVYTATNEFTSAKQVAASVAFFLACGVDASVKNTSGKTALQIAMDEHSMLFDHDQEALLPLFSQNGGDGLNERDENGDTALHRAAREVYSQTIEQLIAAGPDVNATNKLGRTPLHAAVEKLGGWGDSMSIVQILKAKPNVNAQDNEGLTPLHVLLMSDSSFHKEATEALLAAGADPNLRDKRGRTSLHACLSGKWPWEAASDSLGQLVAAGAKTDVADDQGRTPLHYLAARGEQRPMFFIRGLTNAFASTDLNLNATDSAGDTPLHLAVCSGAADVFDWLRTRGALLDMTNAAGQTPRVLALQNKGPFTRFNLGPTTDVAGAARRGEVETLRRSFATEPGEVNATNQTGETALRIAARHGQTNAADELIKLGGEWDAVSATLLGRTDALTAILSRRPAEATNFTGGKALLHLAAESGNIAAIEVLLSVGADLNARARSGLSPLGLALMRKQSEAADIFRSRGVSENIFDAVVLDLPDRAAALLAEDKSRGQIGNAFEFTPAHLAAALDRVQILKMLLDHRVPPDIAAGRLGVSPLHVAVACNRTNATALLLKRGAKVEVTDDAGCTPLHYATVRGSLEAVALLLQHGANPNTAIPSTSGTSPRVPPFARSTPGRTALHFATVSGQTNLIELLLKARANVNATDDLGRTPLDLACPDGQTAMWWMERPSSSPTARLTASFNSLGLPQLENLVPFRPLNSVSSRCPVLAAVLERAGGKPGNRR